MKIYEVVEAYMSLDYKFRVGSFSHQSLQYPPVSAVLRTWSQSPDLTFGMLVPGPNALFGDGIWLEVY
jgi:hypothetical protein